MRFILVAVLIDMIAIGIVVPVLPALVGSFVADAHEQALWYGVLSFAFSFANFLGAPVLGALSDRYGRRPVMLLGFGGLGFNFFAMAWASELWLLIAMRMIGGAMQANIAIANAYVADLSTPAERARRFGQVGAMIGSGFVLGPVIGGALGAMDLRLPFLAAGAFALANLLYGVFVLPESLPPARRRPLRLSALDPFSALRRVARLEGIGGLVGVLALTNLATFVMYTTWVLYMTQRFGWGPRENGWSLFAMGLASFVTQGLLLGPLLRRFSAKRLAVAGLCSSGLSYLAWGAATAEWVVYAVFAANLLGFTITASLQSIVSNAAAPHTQGETLGTVASLGSLMAVVAPLFGAPLMAAVSGFPREDWRVGAPMYFCALLQFAAMALALRIFRHRRRARA